MNTPVQRVRHEIMDYLNMAFPNRLQNMDQDSHLGILLEEWEALYYKELKSTVATNDDTHLYIDDFHKVSTQQNSAMLKVFHTIAEDLRG